MLATYGSPSRSPNLSNSYTYSPDQSFASQQHPQGTFSRVLQSTSENIQAPNNLSRTLHGSSKPRPPRTATRILGPKNLADVLQLPEDDEIFYEACAVKKVENKRGGSGPRSSAKRSKETLQLFKKVPAAASIGDCSRESGYYRYRMSAKKDCCAKEWCKKNNPHVLWPENVERSFQFWIRTILPMGKKKVYANVFRYKSNEDYAKACILPPVQRKQCGRNELISYMIYLDTGEVRDRKQISSHIQVLRHHLKRDNDQIFFKSDGLPSSHDECAVQYEKWGKLNWDPELKRIVPESPDGTRKGSLRSSYMEHSSASSYHSSMLPSAGQGAPADGSLQFTEMHFRLYVTLKTDMQDRALHTYTIAQQESKAEPRNIQDIPEMHSFFPPICQLSEDLGLDQLFYCEASLCMCHDLTAKGYQVGGQMHVTLGCSLDYSDWWIRTTGYRHKGAERMAEPESRRCEWQRRPDGMLRIMLHSSANFWKDLLVDCRCAYEGRTLGQTEGALPASTFSEPDPTKRSEGVLDHASFVQEIFATRDGERVRVAVLLWRFRQATEDESVGLWTWRKIERDSKQLMPGVGDQLTPYQELQQAESASIGNATKTQSDDSGDDFDFNNLSMPIPGLGPVAAHGTPRRHTELDWETFGSAIEPLPQDTQLATQDLAEAHLDDEIQNIDRFGLLQAQPGPSEASQVNDQQMDIDTHAQDSSFQSNASSAPLEAHIPSGGAGNSQTAQYPFDFDGDIEVPSEWEHMDFSVIPGLETPGRPIAEPNGCSRQRKEFLPFPSPLIYNDVFDTQNMPIDPALSAWVTPAMRAGTNHDEHDTDKPEGRISSGIARALTYLAPVSQVHVLKSSPQDIVPGEQGFAATHNETSRLASMSEYSQREAQNAIANIRNHRIAGLEEADSNTHEESQIGFATQSFHSLRDEEPDYRMAAPTESYHHTQDRQLAHSIHFTPTTTSSSNSFASHHWQDISVSATSSFASTSFVSASYTSAAAAQPSTSTTTTSTHLKFQPSVTSAHIHTEPQIQLLDHDFEEIEEICGDGAQLAQLSSFEVCDDGANLAQLAQLHATSLRHTFEQREQPPLPSLSGYRAVSMTTAFAEPIGQQTEHSHSHSVAVLASQQDRIRYPAMTGLEALITAAEGAEQGDDDSSATGKGKGTGGACLEPYQGQPWDLDKGFSMVGSMRMSLDSRHEVDTQKKIHSRVGIGAGAAPGVVLGEVEDDFELIEAPL